MRFDTRPFEGSATRLTTSIVLARVVDSDAGHWDRSGASLFRVGIEPLATLWGSAPTDVHVMAFDRWGGRYRARGGPAVEALPEPLVPGDERVFVLVDDVASRVLRVETVPESLDFVRVLERIFLTAQIADVAARRAALLRLLADEDEIAFFAMRQLIPYAVQESAAAGEIDLRLAEALVSSGRTWQFHAAILPLLSELRGNRRAVRLIDAALDLAARDGSEPIASLALDAVGGMGGSTNPRRKKSFAAAAPALAKILASSADPNIQVHAAMALANVGGKRHSPLLEPARTGDPARRALAAAVLAHWREESPGAITAVEAPFRAALAAG